MGHQKLRAAFVSPFIIGLISATLLISQIFISPASAENPPRKILSGWLDGSPTIYLRSVDSNFNYDVIKDVSPFWYGLASESKITDKYTLGLYTKPITVALQDLKNRGLIVIPTITDDQPVRVLAGILANESRRAVLVNTIRELVAKYNYDGIDLDFEKFYAKGETRANWVSLKPTWVSFIKELSSVLHADGKLLSVTTPPDFDPATKRAGNWVYAWAEMGPHIDRLRIMAYDYSTTTPGPIGPLAWTEDAVKYAVSQMPASKVFVGIPGYGRDWITNVEGVCPAAFAKTIVVGGRAALAMRDAVNIASIYGGSAKYNTTYAENTYVYKKSYTDPTNSAISCTATRTVWYPDERSYAVRAELVGKYRLGGVAVWTFGKETPAAATAIKNVAKAIAPDTVITSLTTDTEQIAYGATFNLTGTFKLPDKSPIAGLNVRLEVKNATDNTWRTIAAGVTDAQGGISTPAIVGQSTQIRLISEGSWERLEGKTIEKSINVSPAIYIQMPATAKVGSNYQITGQVLPKISGVTVLIKRNGVSAGSYITDASGGFNFTISEKESSLVSYQASISANANIKAGSSEIHPLLVR
jgi:spore germination protein YaaH